MSESAHCHDHCHSGEARFRIGRKLAVVSVVFAFVVVISFIDGLEPLNERLLTYLGLIWWAVLLGFLIGGLIDYFVPDGFLIRHLGTPGPAALAKAVLAGLLMSACSHGILAIAMQLYKKGAGVPAVITFLLASPWANLPVTILLIGLFGWRALWFIVAAMAIAVISGAAYGFLGHLGLIEGPAATASANDVRWTNLTRFDARDAGAGVAAGALSLANMVLWWILIGVLIASLIGAYAPQQLFVDYLGPDLPGLLVTLAFATVIEVCSEGSAPIAFEIFDRIGVLGNPFVFLMAGVATDYTEIGLIWSNIGRRAAIWLPIVTVPQIIVVALLLNQFL